MNGSLERKRLKLTNREEELKSLADENLNLELEIEQIKREMKILEKRIEYLTQN